MAEPSRVLLEGGAARATHRLHVGLQRIGIASQMLAANKSSKDPLYIVPWLYRSSTCSKTPIKTKHAPYRTYTVRGAPLVPGVRISCLR